MSLAAGRKPDPGNRMTVPKHTYMWPQTWLISAAFKNNTEKDSFQQWVLEN